MDRIDGKASITWKKGAAVVTADRGVLQGAKFYLVTSRKGGSEITPAVLIAAAHASSFSLALSREVGVTAFMAGEIVVTATVTMEESAAGWTVVNIHLDVIAMLPKVTQGEFIDAAVRSKTSCMVSRLLRAKVSMNAKLDHERLVATCAKGAK